MRRVGLVLVAIALAAGCLGPITSTDTQPGENETANRLPTNASSIQTLATSTQSSRSLGLAVFQGIQPDRVADRTPANTTPISCLRPHVEDRVDVVLLFEEASFPQTPAGDDPVRYVTLLGCAQRPDGLAREAANEAPWVTLASWTDGDAFLGFFDDIGFPTNAADVTFESIPRGYTVSAARNGTGIVDARFVTSPVGVPGPLVNCEPETQNGRSIVEGPDGDLLALDWNKTEAICPAEATVTWPSESPIADVLGPARSPDVVIDTRVEDARFWWRDLPDAHA